MESKPLSIVQKAQVGFGIALALAVPIYFYLLGSAFVNVVARCTVFGTGSGSCEFFNRGWKPGSACARVALRNVKSGASFNDVICSGHLWPGGASTRRLYIRMPRAHCPAPWRKTCDLDVDVRTSFRKK